MPGPDFHDPLDGAGGRRGAPLDLAGVPEQAPDPAQQSLVGALRSGFAVLRILMVVLVVLYVFSGVKQVNPGEQAVIARLGKLRINHDADSEFQGTPIFDQGWRLAWPEPFDERIKLSSEAIQRVVVDTFLFARNEEEIKTGADIANIKRISRSLRPGVDGAILSGDKNLSHGLFEVEYRIADAAKYVQRVGENERAVEPILRRLFESSVLREAGHRRVEEITRTRIDIFADDLRKNLQQELDALETGVQIVKVNANTIVPPQVAAAFDNVTRAENEAKREEEAARQRATELLNEVAGAEHEPLLKLIERYGAAQHAREEAALPGLQAEIDAALGRAQGLVAARLRGARAEASNVRQRVAREQQEFVYWLEQYRLYPLPTLVKLWSQMRAEVLASPDNEVFWVPNSQVIDVLVNRDPDKAAQAETERLRKTAAEAGR